MRIDVTQADIDSGERHECRSCPVALAVNRVLPGGLHSEVSHYVAIVDEKCNWHRSFSIPEVRRFVGQFDRGWPSDVSPFSFDLPGLEEFIASCKGDAS